MIIALLILMGVLAILTLFIFLNMASIAEEYEEEENCSFDEIEEDDIDKFLAWMHARCKE